MFDQTGLTRSKPATGCHHVPPPMRSTVAVDSPWTTRVVGWLVGWLGWPFFWLVKLAVFRFVFKESHRFLEDSLLQQFEGFVRIFSDCRWMNMCAFLQGQADHLQPGNKKPMFLDFEIELSAILPITLQWWKRHSERDFERVRLFLLPHWLSAKQPRFANYAHSDLTAKQGVLNRLSMMECTKNLATRDQERLQLHLLEIHWTSSSSICNNSLKIKGGCLRRFSVNSQLAASADGATPFCSSVHCDSAYSTLFLDAKYRELQKQCHLRTWTICKPMMLFMDKILHLFIWWCLTIPTDWILSINRISETRKTEESPQQKRQVHLIDRWLCSSWTHPASSGNPEKSASWVFCVSIELATHPKKAMLGKPCCFVCVCKKHKPVYFNWSQYVYHHPLRRHKTATVTKISIRRAGIVNRTRSFFHSKHSFYNDRRRWASFTVLNFSVIFIPRKTLLDQKRRWVPFGVDSINSISPNITNIPTVSLHSLIHLFFLKKSSSKEKLLPSVCFSLDLLQHTKPEGFYRFFWDFFFIVQEWLDNMLQSSLEPNSFTFGAFLRGCEKLRDVEAAHAVLRKMQDVDVAPNRVLETKKTQKQSRRSFGWGLVPRESYDFWGLIFLKAERLGLKYWFSQETS